MIVFVFVIIYAVLIELLLLIFMNVLNFLALNKEESDNCWDYNLYCIRKTLIDMLYVQILVVNKNMSSKQMRKSGKNMKDLHITLVLVYGISYQRIYKPLKMYICL